MVVVSKFDWFGDDAPDVLATIQTLALSSVKTIAWQLGRLDLMSRPGKLMLSRLRRSR